MTFYELEKKYAEQMQRNANQARGLQLLFEGEKSNTIDIPMIKVLLSKIAGRQKR